MSTYRNRLPQLDGSLFLTDGGLETTLIYHEGVALPYFAAFPLLHDAAGSAMLRSYYGRYVDLAVQHGVGIVLESATWRANQDWAGKLGYDAIRLADANRRGIEMLLELRERLAPQAIPAVVSGCLGPRGDGYRPELRMSSRAALNYHRPQVETFAATEADMVAALTLNYVEEAVGIAQAARETGIPVAISFTVETDGHLPSGDSLETAIALTDEETDGYPAYYMINCAHPSHFQQALLDAGDWRGRIRGLRANASRRSHAELDNSTELDIGDPLELGREHATLRALLPQLAVVGGCCGTDHRHVEAICISCLAAD